MHLVLELVAKSPSVIFQELIEYFEVFFFILLRINYDLQTVDQLINAH